MPDTATPSPANPAKITICDWLPWLTLGLGVFTWPLLLLIEHLLEVKPTHSQPAYEAPILLFGFCLSVFSVLFTRIPIWLRLLVSVLGAIGFIAVYFATSIALMTIYGVPGC